ncbi:putative leucine-rich repeat protein (LRRP) [Trypanosoma rangeli]|uniref:Putative leucine-rich repeat protein (LRRP) n=1 Tax=Trypanosoma rangeli TaxID=5698 RepID=A0A3R7MDI1_TRYRA|nr:putative leucine-rich repeat protein (LRRP) [Trypanosoma rangeli]RNF00584.1 putative leucine-rich repeat protein (LRRP) [Trypanosoma rangeli]|eukprot:RNF00584.1 putative leucine-rich repeat protein (LRRP) [Trypanosoma rangeli]
MEHFNWLNPVANTIPAHHPELPDATIATLIRGDRRVFCDCVALPYRYRQRMVSGDDDHHAKLVGVLWRKRPLSGQNTEEALYLHDSTNNILVVEDMRSVCHVFSSDGVSPPAEHPLYWLARPRH